MRYRVVVGVTSGGEHVIAETDQWDDAVLVARKRRDYQETQIAKLGGFTPGEGVRVYDGGRVVWSYKWPTRPSATLPSPIRGQRP